ncbi:MAG: hypothetical protein LBB90_08375, partial [Tannerella sp.]|nr:hypothetical protein [Tannerella sp.]
MYADVFCSVVHRSLHREFIKSVGNPTRLVRKYTGNRIPAKPEKNIQEEKKISRETDFISREEFSFSREDFFS